LLGFSIFLKKKKKKKNAQGIKEVIIVYHMHANLSASKIILKSARLTETVVELKNQT
jgi:hypothetical protein